MEIFRRRVLFFSSSNPSISTHDEYPLWSSSNENILDYFNNRFGGGKKIWIKDGIKALKKKGAYHKFTMYWAFVRKYSKEILNREAVPGVDYALSEVVHCKSKSEAGVAQASNECAKKYLQDFLNVTNPKVLFVVGKLAGEVIRTQLRIAEKTTFLTSYRCGNKTMCIVFIPHPNSRGLKKLENILCSQQIEYLQSLFRTS